VKKSELLITNELKAPAIMLQGTDNEPKCSIEIKYD
jgi:hypothetical protein